MRHYTGYDVTHKITGFFCKVDVQVCHDDTVAGYRAGGGRVDRVLPVGEVQCVLSGQRRRDSHVDGSLWSHEVWPLHA